MTPEAMDILAEVLRAPLTSGGSTAPQQLCEHESMAAAVALYEVAAAYGSGSVADIGAKAGLEEAEAAAGWQMLAEMGLIRLSGGRVETVDPDTALAVVMGRYTANVHEQLQAALAVNDATQKLLTVFRPAAARRHEEVAVEQYTGPEARDAALLDIAAALRESLDTAHQGFPDFALGQAGPAGPAPHEAARPDRPGAGGGTSTSTDSGTSSGTDGGTDTRTGSTTPDPAALDRYIETDARLAQRGVRVRALYPRTMLGTPAGARFLNDLSDVGVTVRVIDHVAHDMLVFDRHTVCLPGGLGDISESMIRIRGSVLVQSFASIYESYWQRATPLSLAIARPQHAELTRQERAVIRLMTNGYSDDRIARRLDIDTSVVQHVMSTLMERLGAGSRFEVGYKLARELDPRDL